MKKSNKPNFSRQDREAYVDVQAVIVDARPFQRGRIIGVQREGIWRFPRLGPGGSALPPAQLPHVLVG